MGFPLILFLFGQERCWGASFLMKLPLFIADVPQYYMFLLFMHYFMVVVHFLFLLVCLLLVSELFGQV